MFNYKVILISFSLLFQSIQLNGQNNVDASVGLGISSNGITGQVAVQKSPKSAIRLVGGYLSFNLNNLDYLMDNREFKVNSNLRLSGASLLYDWYPGGSYFKFVGGVGYSMSRINGNMKLKDSLSMGQINFTSDEIGNAYFSISPIEIMPYLGLGFGRAIPKNKLNFQLEFGTYYMYNRSVEFVCDGLIEPTSDQQKVISENLKGYIFLPNISIIVSYKIK